MGRLQGSIARRVTEILVGIRSDYSSNLDAAFNHIFRRLVSVDAAGNVSRQWASLKDLRAEGEPVPGILDALIDGRILLAENDRDGANESAVVALSHEALIGEWPELAEWLEGNRAVLHRIKRQLLNLVAPEVGDRIRAAESIAEIGPTAAEAVPALAKALRDKDERLCRLAADALSKIGPAAISVLIAALRDQVENVRLNAAGALREIGLPAIPMLSAAFDDQTKDARLTITKVLGRIGPVAVPALAEVLHDKDNEVRQCATKVLDNILLEIDAAIRENKLSQSIRETMELVASAVVPALAAAVGDEDMEVRHGAVIAIGNPWFVTRYYYWNPADALEAVSALTKALRDEYKDVRRSAAEALGKIGHKAAEAIPALIETICDEDEVVRCSAAETLGKIGPAAAEAVPALTEALCHGNDILRCNAAEALGKIGPAAAEAIPALEKALRDEDGRLRSNAAEALGKIGPEAADAVPALVEALRGGNDVLRSNAAEALGRIGSAAAIVVPALTEAIGRSTTGLKAIVALGRIGPEAAEAVPAIGKALSYSDEEICDAAEAALKNIGSLPEELQRTLEQIDYVRRCKYQEIFFCE